MKKTIIILTILTLLLILFRPVLSSGTCLNAAGDGHLEKCTDGLEEPYTYISYRNIAAAGDKVLTLDIKNPLSTECDDLILIMDYNVTTKKLSVR